MRHVCFLANLWEKHPHPHTTTTPLSPIALAGGCNHGKSEHPSSLPLLEPELPPSMQNEQSMGREEAERDGKV